jgi:hypothetical protein
VAKRRFKNQSVDQFFSVVETKAFHEFVDAR